MNDPHVHRVVYSCIPEEDENFDNAVPCKVEQPQFNGELSNYVLSLEMTEHFAAVENARPIIEEYLSGWAITAALHAGHSVFKFKYDRCEIVDRQPLPTEGVQLSGHISGTVTLSGSLKVVHIHENYPEPPVAFRSTQLIEMLWNRYHRFTLGKEPLSAMAYFCLTAIMAYTGKERDISNRYRISIQVLSRLRQLSSTVGTENDARKMTDKKLKPASPSEIEWIRMAITKIIYQIIGTESGDRQELLDMNELPRIVPA